MDYIPDIDRLNGALISLHSSQAGVLRTDAQRDVYLQISEFIKRLMDILMALLLGLTLLPFLLLIALFVYLDSPGPILYSQQRMGKDGRKILIYKFRSMQVNADHILAEHLQTCPFARIEWETTQKLRSDPRITRVGRWIREFSLDELPQLINILKGDMSLVGPRPILNEQMGLYGDRIECYFRMRPGLTGLWQVSGRNHTTFRQRTLYDEYYIGNWSIWLDLKILIRTIWVVLSRDGAY